MALPGPPEIARPPSNMVVVCTCSENRVCARENRPCECISVLHRIVTNHPTGLSFSSVSFYRVIPERATLAQVRFRTWPRFLARSLAVIHRTFTKIRRTFALIVFLILVAGRKCQERQLFWAEVVEYTFLYFTIYIIYIICIITLYMIYI